MSIDIRLISATNKDLNQLIVDGFFREDLLYRINTITIELPPLREREKDVLLLAEFYLKKYAYKYNKPEIILSTKACNKLMEYNWPGNVRELQHAIEKAVILAGNKEITEDLFTFRTDNWIKKTVQTEVTIEKMEQIMIEKNIEKENGNMSAVAQNLGITRQTLYNKLKKYAVKIQK